MSAVPEAGAWRIRLPDGSDRLIEAERLEDDALSIRVGDRRIYAPFAVDGKSVSISFEGIVYEFMPSAGPAVAAKTATASGTLTAPMVGSVTQLYVSEGDAVEAYQPLAVVEAMKVLVTLEAPFTGIVRDLRVNRGDRVDHGAQILQVVPDDHSPVG